MSARRPRAARFVQADQIGDAARKLLTQAYLTGLQFDDVVAVLKDADRALAAGASGTHHRENDAR